MRTQVNIHILAVANSFFFVRQFEFKEIIILSSFFYLFEFCTKAGTFLAKIELTLILFLFFKISKFDGTSCRAFLVDVDVFEAFVV